MGAWRVLLADASIELAAQSHSASEQLRSFFGGLPATSRPPDVRLHVALHEEQSPEGAPEAIDGPMAIWDNGDYVQLRHRDGLSATVRAREISVGGWRDARVRALRQTLGSALASWFGGLGTVVLHGALIEREGLGLAVLGPTGSGKSTLAVAALAAGWRVHADDLTLVRQSDNGRFVAHGLPKPVMADAEVVVGLGFEVHPLDDDPRGRGVLPAALVEVGWVAIEALVVVAHSEQSGSITPLHPAECLTAVFSSSFEAARARGRRRDLPILARLSSLDTFRLEHAVQPQQRVERAAAMLDEISRHLVARAAQA